MYHFCCWVIPNPMYTHRSFNNEFLVLPMGISLNDATECARLYARNQGEKRAGIGSVWVDPDTGHIAKNISKLAEWDAEEVG